MKQLIGGAGVPNLNSGEILTALNNVARDCDVDPAAIAGIIHTESLWDTQCGTGKYIGLTQVGPDFVDWLGYNEDEFLELSAAEQIEAYGKWLAYYHFSKQVTEYGMKVGIQPLARQAAVLQAMQFSPNGSGWKTAFASENYSIPSTDKPQARFLGNTSIHDMEAYYLGFFLQHPPAYAGAGWSEVTMITTPVEPAANIYGS